jgi:hypothetical protein
MNADETVLDWRPPRVWDTELDTLFEKENECV